MPDQTGAGGKDASKGSGKPVDFENFWEAPAYYWQPKEVTEREIEAVMVSFVILLLISSSRLERGSYGYSNGSIDVSWMAH